MATAEIAKSVSRYDPQSACVRPPELKVRTPAHTKQHQNNKGGMF